MEVLELINIWMTTFIPVITELLKRAFPDISARVAAIIVLVLFIGVFLLFGASVVELFVSVVTALASYDLLWKPAVFTPLMGKRPKP